MVDEGRGTANLHGVLVLLSAWLEVRSVSTASNPGKDTPQPGNTFLQVGLPGDDGKAKVCGLELQGREQATE